MGKRARRSKREDAGGTQTPSHEPAGVQFTGHEFTGHGGEARETAAAEIAHTEIPESEINGLKIAGPEITGPQIAALGITGLEITRPQDFASVTGVIEVPREAEVQRAVEIRGVEVRELEVQHRAEIQHGLEVRRAPGLPDWLPRDLECLVAIARRHAAIVLAGHPKERASRLKACRVVWINYAAAFCAGAAAQKRFADDLQKVTRALMAEQQKSLQKSGTAPEAHAGISPLLDAPVLTIEELRPLLRQIIRQ